LCKHCFAMKRHHRVHSFVSFVVSYITRNAAGIIIDDYLYGRGTIDTKISALSILEAVEVRTIC
jgi:hypothetical protein